MRQTATYRLGLVSFRLVSMCLMFVAAGCDRSDVGQTFAEPQRPGSDLSSYLFFSKWEDAATWARTHEQSMAAAHGAVPRQILAQDSPAYQKVIDGFGRMWASWSAEYPGSTKALSRPYLIVLQDDQEDGFVPYDRVQKKTPWLVEITSGAAEKLSTNAILALAAHELAHGVFHARQQLETFYFAGADGVEPMGRDASEDPEARKLGEAWLSIANLSADFSLPELNGIPVRRQNDSVYSRFFKFLVKSYLAPATCGEALKDIEAMQVLLRGRLDRLDFSFKLTDVDRLQLQVITTGFLGRSAACYQGPRPDLVAMLNAMAGEDLLAKLEGAGNAAMAASIRSDIEVFNASSDPFAGLTVITKKHVLDLVELTQDPRFARLRRFTTEEDADNVSARVMARLGLPAGSYFREWMGESAVAACDALIAAGRVPPYGTFADPHHGQCYRLYNSLRIAAEVNHP